MAAAAVALNSSRKMRAGGDCVGGLLAWMILAYVAAEVGSTSIIGGNMTVPAAAGAGGEHQSASAKYRMAPTETTVMVDGHEVPHFKVGLLAPWKTSYDDFSALTSASAISLAIEAIHADPSLNKRMRFSVISYDSGCNSKVAAGNAVRLMVEEKVDAFIGPPCSSACRPAAELASYWNKPVVSWVATDPDFNDKNIFTTFGRVLGPFNKMGTFLVEVFNQYKWKRCAVLSSNYFLWYDASKAIRSVFRENNITIAYEPTYDRFPPDSMITKVMTKTKEEARIVLVIAPKEDRRRLMLKAHDLGMTKGEYVFYTIEMLPDEKVLNAEDVWSSNDGRDEQAKQAFEAVFHVTLAALSNAAVNDFRKEVARRMLLPPWDAYVGDAIDMDNFKYGDKYSPFLYDAMMLYAVSLNESVAKGSDPRSGVAIAEQMKGKTFKGMTGSLVLDENADREPDYWITDMHPNGTFLKIAEVLNTDNGVRVFSSNLLPPRWPNGKVGHEFAPPDTPACGFRNEFCPDESIPAWIFIMITVLVLIAIGVGIGVGIFLYKRAKFETDLLVQGWKIHFEDIEPLKANSKKGGSTPTLGSQASSSHSTNNVSKSMPSMPSICTGGGQMFTDVGVYNGIVIAIKHIKKQHMQVSRNVLLEFNELKEVVHDNLNAFVGACIEPPNICLIWQYCSKGSLQDVLFDDAVKLDNTFKLSFMTDIAKGMQYLHTSHLISHGNLKSSNCLIDNRWTLRITDYGLPSFLSGQDFKENEADVSKRKLWTSPEILRENFPNPRGTQKGDVYSFSIVCYEIMMRSEPYCFDDITPKDVVNRIRNGESIPYRPKLPESSELGRPLVDLLKACWDEVADQRPTFIQIRSSLRKITNGEINILDNILHMMEKFANNLEEIVEERTQQLVEEKKKTDRLLYRMLPSSVAEALKAGTFVKPENYDQSTIYFSDIVGFTQLAAESNPMQIVDFLNDLYTCFDDIIEKHDVYKVETIGDAYMCVSGVPVRNGSRHCAEIANCALSLLSEVTHFKIKHRPKMQLQLKVGLHMGPVVAGVVGNIMPRYCLFGDTVNMAARMESTGKPLRIHISKILYNALSEVGGFEMTLRGEMSVKGKGLQMTYWLHGKRGFDKPLPAFDKAEANEEVDDKADASGGTKNAMMQSYDTGPEEKGASASAGKGGLPAVV